jgi:hypothetical protein
MNYDYNKTDLVKILNEYANILKTSPTQKQVNDNKNIPSTRVFFRVFETQSWNKVLKQSGLQSRFVKNYDKEEAIIKLKNFYDSLGYIPSRKDFKENNFYPHHDWYSENFNGYENACNLAGLIKKPNKKQTNLLYQSITELRHMAQMFNRCPTAIEYDDNVKNGLKRRALENRLKLKYNDICRKYIPKYKLNNTNGDILKEDIIKTLQELNSGLGRPPLFKELKKYGYTYSYNLFNRLFPGMSYNQIVESLGWKPSYSTTIIKTEDEMLNSFYELFKKLKRIPYGNDFLNSNISSMSTYNKYFGSIENVCKLLNIDYDLYYQGNSIGKICFDKLGNMCKSISEMIISNYFIDNNIKFDKEPYYSEITNCKGKRFDWKIYIKNKIYYVEYFGLYDIYSNNKIAKNYTKKVKKKIKILYKNDSIDKCIFIFPNDFKSKSLDEIFKSYLDINYIKVS